MEEVGDTRGSPQLKMFELLGALLVLIIIVVGVYLIMNQFQTFGALLIAFGFVITILLLTQEEEPVGPSYATVPTVIPTSHTRRLTQLSVERDPYTPQQVGSVYLHPDFRRDSSSTTASYGGAGQKIGIITCFNHPYLQRDFDVFCIKYGLPQKTLIIHNRARTKNTGWAIETCLDTQWAHVFAPLSEIHVFQAQSNQYSALKLALQDAVAAGMNIVSMSLGSAESVYADQQVQSIFESNPQIIFMAASGDWCEVMYPSSSPHVVSVGGTRLHIEIDGKTNARRPQDGSYEIDPALFSKIGETDWSTPNGVGSGHGISNLYTRPSYQVGHNASEKRATPDVSLIASSPSQNGVSVYFNPNPGSITDTRVINNTRCWLGVEGTSVSCPILAGMIATINAKRGAGNWFTRTQLMEYLYSQIPTNLPVETSHDGVGFIGRNFMTMCSLVD